MPISIFHNLKEDSKFLVKDLMTPPPSVKNVKIYENSEGDPLQLFKVIIELYRVP